MIGFDPKDLGLTSDATIDTDTADVPGSAGNTNLLRRPKCGQSPTIVNGSVMAKIIYNAWRGLPCIVLDSPPGAGKTSTIIDVAGVLAKDAYLKVLILTSTNASGRDVITRLIRRWGEGAARGHSSALSGVHQGVEPPEENGEIVYSPFAESMTIAVRTVASAAMTGLSRYKYDIVIVDEAYQSTFASLSRALSSEQKIKDGDDDGPAEFEDTSIQQVILIGDPGQIGPVVLDPDSPLLANHSVPVTTPAPTAMKKFPDTLTLSLPSTYRLGPDTADIVSELYDFEFESRRPEMSVEDLGEINSMVVKMAERADGAVSYEIAEEAVATLGAKFSYTDIDGIEQERPIGAGDIAIVAAHNDQVSSIQSALTAVDDGAGEAITVGTADSLQGGQWPVVFALDPLSGVDRPSDHHFSLGRLCVMLSRHMGALVWVYEKGWKTKISDYVEDEVEAETHRLVRSRVIESSYEL